MLVMSNLPPSQHLHYNMYVDYVIFLPCLSTHTRRTTVTLKWLYFLKAIIFSVVTLKRLYFLVLSVNPHSHNRWIDYPLDRNHFRTLDTYTENSGRILTALRAGGALVCDNRRVSKSQFWIYSKTCNVDRYLDKLKLYDDFFFLGVTPPTAPWPGLVLPTFSLQVLEHTIASDFFPSDIFTLLNALEECWRARAVLRFLQESARMLALRTSFKKKTWGSCTKGLITQYV